eukprot:31555-Pelagococcus_subviridis.AAC.3
MQRPQPGRGHLVDVARRPLRVSRVPGEELLTAAAGEDARAVRASRGVAREVRRQRDAGFGSFYTSACRGGVQRRQTELKGVEAGD